MKNKFLPTLLLSAVLGISFFARTSAAADTVVPKAVQSLAVQHNGRVMSFDCFSRQILSAIAQKSSWKRQPTWSVILRAAADPKTAADLPWIRVGGSELIGALGLPSRKDQFYSYNEILPLMDKLGSLISRSQHNGGALKGLKALGQKADALDSAVYQVRELLSGRSLRVIPPVSGQEWSAPAAGAGPDSDEFIKLMEAYKAARQAEFASALARWTERVDRQTGFRYRQQIHLEILYYAMKPFEMALILYLVAFVWISFFGRRRGRYMPGIFCLGTALIFHTAGLLLRMFILSRPPVANMYESIIFANWVIMIAAIIFATARRSAAILSVGALISALIMVYGNLLPIDASLDVLAPVLRSNYWLAMHVLTIVASYGIFALAMGLGHRQLTLTVRGRWKASEEAKSAQVIYRSLQAGLLLSGIGIVLGGVWANETWGRFWGWDPKETWALITFLGYLVIIHLYHQKRLSAFALGAASILSFQLVLMTWYGVNFVLGTGLHSYGQGSGGAGWVVLYLALEALFLLWAVSARRQKV
ncbi:MAG: cytochrome c biogenesis protein CcsA [Candidatus Omnitrophota bacterium]